jgi:hypothetical protein
MTSGLSTRPEIATGVDGDKLVSFLSLSSGVLRCYPVGWDSGSGGNQICSDKSSEYTLYVSFLLGMGEIGR